MPNPGDEKTCERCGGTMIYKVDELLDSKYPKAWVGKRATGWFCVACPHLSMHVVLR